MPRLPSKPRRKKRARRSNPGAIPGTAFQTRAGDHRRPFLHLARHVGQSSPWRRARRLPRIPDGQNRHRNLDRRNPDGPSHRLLVERADPRAPQAERSSGQLGVGARYRRILQRVELLSASPVLHRRPCRRRTDHQCERRLRDKELLQTMGRAKQEEGRTLFRRPNVGSDGLGMQRGGTKAEGLGLGLFITPMLVEALGGAISAESHPGKGTSFRFTIPVEAPHAPP